MTIRSGSMMWLMGSADHFSTKATGEINYCTAHRAHCQILHHKVHLPGKSYPDAHQWSWWMQRQKQAVLDPQTHIILHHHLSGSSSSLGCCQSSKSSYYILSFMFQLHKPMTKKTLLYILTKHTRMLSTSFMLSLRGFKIHMPLPYFIHGGCSSVISWSLLQPA